MPSPFPGMDPFLEAPEIFPDLHDSMIVHLKETLQARLPKNKYYAMTGARVWVDAARRPIGPDVRVHEAKDGRREGRGTGNGRATAAAVETTLPIVVSIPREEIRETFVNIFAKRKQGARLVTSIEVLCPTNKTPRGRGRKRYLKMQREVLAEQVNLVEIDLLRGGKHVTAVPLAWALAETAGSAYHVCVHRFCRPDEFAIFPIQLDEPLPVIGVPLLPDDADVALPLQEIFTQTYDAGAYRELVDYAGAVPPPPAQEKGARSRLRQLFAERKKG